MSTELADRFIMQPGQVVFHRKKVNKAATMSKAEANYRPGTDALHRCRNCSMYRVSGDDDGGECTLVKGYIAGDATCDHWEHAEDVTTKVYGLTVADGSLKVRGRDPGGTERLDRYWTEGEGAAKIDWGTPGDFDRCVAQLGKYIHEDHVVKGHCARLHHRALGIWPATHAKEEREAGGGKKMEKAEARRVVAAGLAVVAADTGRVLMLQRDNEDGADLAAGLWEFPGGKLEDEGALQAARREWAEETGLKVPTGQLIGSWTSPDGVYAGYVWLVPHELKLDITGPRDAVDDPDGDRREALAWWTREHFLENPGLRPELRDIVNNVADVVWPKKTAKLLKSWLNQGVVSQDEVKAELADDDFDAQIHPVNEVQYGGPAGTFTYTYNPLMTMSTKTWASYQGMLNTLTSSSMSYSLKPIAAKMFDPAEPRDEHGKWIHLAGIADALKAWRNPKTGKVYVGGTVENGKHSGGQLIGKINMNADGTFSGSHGGLDTGKQKVKIATSHQGHQGAVTAVGHYHAMDLLQAEAQKSGNLQAHAHLVNAQKALGAGNAKLAHDELNHAHAAMGDGELKASTHGLYNAHGDLHGLNNEKLHTSATTLKPAEKNPMALADWEQALMDVDEESSAPNPMPYENVGFITDKNTTSIPLSDGNGGTKYEVITNDAAATTIGEIKRAGPDNWFAIHADGTTTASATGPLGAKSNLITYHNANYTNFIKPAKKTAATPPKLPLHETGVPEPKPAEETPDWVKAGKISFNDVKFTTGTGGSLNVNTKDGAHVGTISQSSAGKYEFVAQHASGFGTGTTKSKISAANELVNLHNEKIDQWHQEHGDQLAGEKKPYETIGKIKPSDLYPNGAGDFTYQGEDGQVIGHYKPGSGSFEYSHADGTKLGTPGALTGKEIIAAYHNQKYGGEPTPVNPEPKIVEMHEVPETPAPVPTATGTAGPYKAYHAAGTMLTPQDVTVKKTGEVIDKKTKIQIGTVGKNGSYWQAQHVNGHAINYGSQKGETVKQLLNHHNQITAMEQTVKQGDQGAWQSHGKVAAYSLHAGFLDDNGVSAVTNNINGEHLGDIKVHQSGINFEVTHNSGAKFLVNNPSLYHAKTQLAEAHNNGLKLSQGEDVHLAKPATTVGDFFNTSKPPGSTLPKQPYELVGTVSPGSFTGTNVQKDESGKIISSDMTYMGHVIGHTQAEPGGTVTLTHADGHVIGTGITPGQGQLTDKLAAYHNKTYGPPEAPKAPGIMPGVTAHVTTDHTHTIEPVTHEEKTALKQYTGSAYESINDKLRNLQWGSERPTTKVAGLMHDGIEKSRLKEDTTLYRGITNVDGIFGPMGSKVGQVFTEHGFVSTSTQSHTAFGGDARLIIHAPKGTHGMDVKSFSYYGHENEVLLQHGTKFKVNSDTVGEYGKRIIDLTVISPINTDTEPST